MYIKKYCHKFKIIKIYNIDILEFVKIKRPGYQEFKS